MNVYLVGPISGKGYDEVVDLYTSKIKIFKSLGYDVLCPMAGKSYLRNELEFKSHGIINCPVATNHAIFERDVWMVRTSDIIFADFSNSDNRVSIGSCMELAIASYLNKHTISVIPKEDIHNHAFVLEASDIIFETQDEAYDYFEDLNKNTL